MKGSEIKSNRVDLDLRLTDYLVHDWEGLCNSSSGLDLWTGHTNSVTLGLLELFLGKCL